MTLKWARPAAAIVAAASAALYAGYLVWLLRAGPSPTGPELPFQVLWPLPFLMMALVGLLVTARRPGNTVGWLFLVTGFLFVGNGFAQAYAEAAFRSGWKLPAAGLAAWIGFWLWMPAWVLITIILVLFPTGRLPSPRWRPFVWTALFLIVAVPFAALPTLPARGPLLLEAPSPGSVPGGGLLEPLAAGGIPLLTPIGLAALVGRFRRARDVERLQLKWLVFAAAFLAAVIAAMFFIPAEDPIDHPVGAGALLLGMTALPVAVGVAILRYRLYEVDRIINRTLVYGSLTILLAGVYFGGVTLLESSFRALTGQGSPLAIVLSTMAIAAVFTPLRRRIQATIDHRFYRSKYDAQRALAAFGTAARDEVELERLAQALVGAVDETMQPATFSMWVKESQ